MNNKIKTLLLHLPLNEDNNDSTHQPYGLAIVSSYLKSHGCDVTLHDANAYQLTTDEIISYIQGLSPTILGLTVYTNQLSQTISFLKKVKELLPDIITVVGGPHPSSDEHESLLRQNKAVDVVVIGEGEYTMLELVKNIQNGKPLDQTKGIAYRTNGEIKVNHHREYIEDLDSLPFADWDSLPMDKYWAVSAEKKVFVNVLFSRGCKFNCTFCGSRVALGQEVRKRSPKSIVKEIEHLYEEHHARELCINDATFNVDNKWVSEICEGILKLNKPDLVWGCNLRADRMDRETLKLMKRSGCSNIFLGAESGDDNMLKSMKKGTNVEMIRNALRMIDEEGIKIYCGFILGMPGETEESINNTLNFAREFRKYSVAFSLATPFPGTELYKRAQMEGFHVDDWTTLDYHGITYVPEGLTKEKLYYYYNRTVLNYYLSFTFIINQLIQIKSWLQFKKTFRLGYRILVGRRRRLKKMLRTS